MFWKDPKLNGVSFNVVYVRLFNLAVNKLFTVTEMFL